MPYLELDGVMREMPAGETTVGSGAQATWRVASHDLAAKHFVVTLDDAGSGELRPCSNQSVVVLNGQQVPMRDVVLRHGDVIAAGTARFRYLGNGSEPGEPLVEAPAGVAHLIDEQSRGAYPLSHRTITIGRDISSVVRIRDPRVSRFHADIRAEAGAFVLYPMGASGTVVSGQRITTPHVLQEGDRITIGDTTLRFTRVALPADVHPADGELDPGDPQAMRATLLHAAVRTGEHVPAERPIRIWLLAVSAVVLALIGYIVFV